MALAGTWKQDRTDKMDEYLKEIGLGMVKRTLVCNSSPKMVITVDGAKWNIDTSTIFSKQIMAFTVGEEFETDMPGVADGVKFKCQATLDGDKISMVAKPDDASMKASETTREMDGDELLMTMKCGDVVCKRWFKKA